MKYEGYITALLKENGVNAMSAKVYCLFNGKLYLSYRQMNCRLTFVKSRKNGNGPKFV